MYVAGCLRANSTQMTVVTDRAQSCASLQDGAFEVVVHRRLLYDDHRGVGEPLNETEAVCTRMVLAVDPLDRAADRLRQQAELVNNPLQLYFANQSALSALSAGLIDYAPLLRPLPRNLKLLSLQTLEQHPLMMASGSGPILLRLAHIYSSSDASHLAQPSSVDLNELFVDFKFCHIVETSLTANQRLANVKRLVWQLTDAPPSTAPPPAKLTNTTIILHPMQIRTFLVAPRPR
jgi:lysosomal alpha-mannosidase